MAERLRLSSRTIDRYRDSLTTAHRCFEEKAEPIIKKMAAYLKGDQWRVDKDVKGMIAPIVVNLIYADIKVMLPVLALRNPRAFVKPTKATVTVPLPIGPPDPMTGQPTPVPTPCQMLPGPNGQTIPIPILAAARAQEMLLNWRIRQLRLNRQFRRCLQDSLLAPFGVMKMGYTLETEKVKAPTPTEEMEELLGAPEGGRTLLEVQDAIKAESPFAVRWSPRDFRVDPEARYPDLSDARWIAFRSLHRLSDVQANPRYRNTRGLKATVQVDRPEDRRMASTERLRESDPDEFLRVEIWELWDKAEGKLVSLAEDHDKALQYDDWPNAHATFPAETLYFDEHPEELYGLPALAQVLPQQDSYNEYTALILNHVRRYGIQKMLMTFGAINDEDLLKVISPIEAVIPVQGKINESIGPMPLPNVPVDLWQGRAQALQDHDRVSGISDLQRAVAEKVDTATEAGLLQQNLNVRVNDARAIMEDFAQRVCSQLLKIDAVTIPLPATIPVVGPDGAIALNQWVRVQTRATLQAETSVEVEIGSMQPINQETKKRDTLQVFSMFRNDPLVNQVALAKRTMDVFYDALPDGKELLIPEDVVAQVRAQLEAEAQAAAGTPPAAPPPGGPGPRPGGTPPARLAPRPAGRPAGGPGPRNLAAAVAPGQEV